MENQLNIDPKRHRKNDAKNQGTKMANKTIFDSREGPYTFSPPSSPPWSPRGAYKFPGFGSRLGEGKGEGKPRCSNTPQDPGGVGGYGGIYVSIFSDQIFFEFYLLVSFLYLKA